MPIFIIYPSTFSSCHKIQGWSKQVIEGDNFITSTITRGEHHQITWNDFIENSENENFPSLPKSWLIEGRKIDEKKRAQICGVWLSWIICPSSVLLSFPGCWVVWHSVLIIVSMLSWSFSRKKTRQGRVAVTPTNSHSRSDFLGFSSFTATSTLLSLSFVAFCFMIVV